MEGEPWTRRTSVAPPLMEHTVDDLERYLERQIDFEDLLEELRPWLNPRQYAAGEALVGPDAPQEGLQLLLAGRASGYDSAGTRLFQCGPGEAIWPTGASDQKAASVVADAPCQTMVLTPGRPRLAGAARRAAYPQAVPATSSPVVSKPNRERSNSKTDFRS